MKTLYKFFKSLVSKSKIGLLQDTQTKLDLLEGKLYVDESESLLSQMYTAENETLFI